MFLRFSRQEVYGLIVALLITGFVFSFNDWGEETFSMAVGLFHLAAASLVAVLSFFFRISCQKIYALSQGYQAEFKVWWTGLIIMVVLIFVTVGKLPIVLIGGAVASFMVRQRLGEYRYGHSHFQESIISLWGILGNLIAAILFAVGLYFFPQNYFFNQGLILNLIMGFTSLLPFPQLDGLKIFFGSRVIYLIGIFTVILASILLLTYTKIGLIIAIVLGTAAGAFFLLIGSEK